MKRINNLLHALMSKKNRPLLLLEGLIMLLKFGNVNENKNLFFILLLKNYYSIYFN